MGERPPNLPPMNVSATGVLRIFLVSDLRLLLDYGEPGLWV